MEHHGRTAIREPRELLDRVEFLSSSGFVELHGFRKFMKELVKGEQDGILKELQVAAVFVSYSSTSSITVLKLLTHQSVSR